MTSIDWYYARGNKQMGPVSSADLKRLADAGELEPDDLVWREGLTEWAAARSVRGLFEEDRSSAAHSEAEPSTPAAATTVVHGETAEPERSHTAPRRAPARHPIDAMFDALRGDFNARFVDSTSKVFRACGLYGLLLGMLLTLAFAVIAALQGDAFGNLLAGVMWLIVLASLHYAAGKSCEAVDRLNRSSSGSLSTSAIPDCVAGLSMALGLVVLFSSAPIAVQGAMYPLIALGIAGFIVCTFLAFVALNPVALGIAVTNDEPPASAEAVGAVMFLMKALLRCTPVAFGAGVLAGAIVTGYACCEALLSSERAASAWITAAVGRETLALSAALPWLAYLLFLLGNLAIDFFRAVLVLPGKIDKPRE